MSGPISVLTGLIGTPDGADAAAKMSEVVGIDIGESVKKASRKLKGRGIAVEVARGKIATMWIHVSIADEGHFGSAPLVYPWWQGGQLIDGVPNSATREEALAVLGEPERSGVNIRYRVGDAYMSIGFGKEGITNITLMSEAP